MNHGIFSSKTRFAENVIVISLNKDTYVLH